MAWTAAPPIEVFNPASEELLGTVPSAGPAEAAAALRSAESGLVEWRNTAPWERAAVLRRIGGLLRERAESIALLLTREVGKPLAESRAEIGAAAEYFDWYGDETRRIFGRTIDGRVPGARLEITHEPVGVVLALTAWNFPIILAARKLAMALAAGCSVILRPAEEAPACVAALVRCCNDAGVKRGAINLLFGSPEAIVVPLMAAPSVRKVSFTGSTRVGKILARQAADTVKRMTMELGGHAPFIVLDDADINKAATAAVAAKFRNAGQVCTSPSRFYVHSTIEKAFVEKMVAGARALRVGDGAEEGVQMGPLATARQRERIERLVTDARDKGARVVCGGGRPGGRNRGFFFEPTILTDVPADADLLREEPFGPVAAIMPVGNADEAVAHANSLEFGLAAYLYTRAGDEASVVSSRIVAGVIGVNNTAVALPEAPFGGVKQSGYGREGGDEAIRDYLSTKMIHRHQA